MKRYEKVVRDGILISSIGLPLIGISVITVFLFGCSLMINY